MAAKKRTAILFVLAAIVASSSAFASLPRSPVLEPQPVDSLEIVSGGPLSFFGRRDRDSLLTPKSVCDEVARLSKTRVWVSQLSEPLLPHESSGLNRALRRAHAEVRSENAEEIRDYEITDLYLAASPESKSKLLFAFKGAPFVEPAIGLANFRERWYDPATGTWLTPDAESYAARSSNLYAGFNGDPVNNIDPDGNEPVTGAVVLAYLGNVALQTGIDVAIDWAWHEGADWWNGTDTD